MMTGKGIRGAAVLGALLWALPQAGLGAAVAEAAEAQERGRGDYLTVKIAVMGPGDELYLWWGHLGLIVEDRAAGRSRFYDWGVFSFDNDHFFRNFALGRLLYACGASRAEAVYRAYTASNRDVTVYTLDLDPEAREEVRRFAEWNVLPENRNYYYHHFRDNCATRIRDILDRALGGQFSARYGAAPGRFTLRQHVRRHTWAHPLEDWILNFWMGRGIDQPITVWEEMFLPSEVGARIAEFRYTDAAGRERPLVSAVEKVNVSSGRPAVLDAPHRQWPWELAVGLLLAALCGLCGFLLYKKRWPVPLAIAECLAGLVFGAAGSALFFLAFFTNHDYTYHNLNLLFANPLLLAACPLGLIAAFGKTPAGRRRAAAVLRALWSCAACLCALTLAPRLFPGAWQQNQVTVALFLPIAIALALSRGVRPRGEGKVQGRSLTG